MKNEHLWLKVNLYMASLMTLCHDSGIQSTVQDHTLNMADFLNTEIQ